MAAKPDRDDMMYSQHESMTKEVASELLDELSGHKAGEPVFIRKLYGRRIYSYFWPGMKQMDGTQYDNENGQGKAAEVVAALRQGDRREEERRAESGAGEAAPGGCVLAGGQRQNLHRCKRKGRASERSGRCVPVRHVIGRCAGGTQERRIQRCDHEG